MSVGRCMCVCVVGAFVYAHVGVCMHGTSTGLRIQELNEGNSWP